MHEYEYSLMYVRVVIRLALSATIGPLVALVSAAMTTPPSYRHPTMVVPVLVAFGRGTPRACRAMFLLWLLKSKPAMVMCSCGECVWEVWGDRRI